MGNRFTDSFNPQYTPQYQQQYQQQPQQNMNVRALWNECRSNPTQFLANASEQLNVPQQYRNSPEATARYLLNNMTQNQQNQVFQKANIFRAMFGLF